MFLQDWTMPDTGAETAQEAEERLLALLKKVAESKPMTPPRGQGEVAIKVAGTMNIARHTVLFALGVAYMEVTGKEVPEAYRAEDNGLWGDK